MKNNVLDILLVDESSYIVYQIKHALHNQGICANIDTVETVEDATTYFRDKHPDLVITDLDLPDKSGIELMKAIKGEKGNSKLYVLTHFTIDAFRQMAMIYGADSFLDKANDIETTLPNMIKSYAA
jgi:DNA-binding NarL/FixJ family response regulator